MAKFIELHLQQGGKVTIHEGSIASVTESKPTKIELTNGSVIHVKESYDDVSSMIIVTDLDFAQWRAKFLKSPCYNHNNDFFGDLTITIH